MVLLLSLRVMIFHIRKSAYIVGDWLTNIDSSTCSFDDDSDNEKVVAIMIDSSSSSPTPPPSSSTHLCLMAKGERKVSNHDESSSDEHAINDDSDSDDDEYESPSYDDLARLLKQYTKIIIKTRANNEKLEAKNDSLLAKCDMAEKANIELREANDAISSKLKELKSSKKKLKKT